MRVFERTLPKECISLAGGIVVQFTDMPAGQHDGILTLSGNNVVKVPYDGAFEFFLLAGGTKALFMTTDGPEMSRRKKFWFCGFDGGAFLSEIKEEAYCAFLRKGGGIEGEKSFMQAMKPQVIRKCEGFHPENPSDHRGNIHFCKVGGLSWEQLEQIYLFRDGVRLETAEFTAEKPYPISGKEKFTLAGRVMRIDLFGCQGVLVGSGIMTIKGYLPVNLIVPHIIEESPMLVTCRPD